MTNTRLQAHPKSEVTTIRLTESGLTMLKEFAALTGMSQSEVLGWSLQAAVQNAIAIATNPRVGALTPEEFADTLKECGGDWTRAYTALLKLIRLRMPDWREFFVTCEAAGNPLKMERFNRFYGLTADDRENTAACQHMALLEDGSATLTEVEHQE